MHPRHTGRPNVSGANAPICPMQIDVPAHEPSAANAQQT